jgi:glycosyltransferase involved in cell wall biosynthesis
MRFLQESGASVTFISPHAADARLSRYVRQLQQVGIPAFHLPDDPVEELVQESRFDVALLTFWPVAEFIAPIFRKLSPATRVIVDSVDLHFLRDARRFLQTTGQELPPFDIEYGKQLVGELNVYAHADLVLTVSDKEALVLGDYLGKAVPIRTVPDCEELEPSPIPIEEREGILFIGSFLHNPNVQAAEFLCTEIVPRIDPKLLERHPVYIVGDGLKDSVRSFAEGKPHVRLVGWVPAVEPYLERARVSILPLRYGAGTKRKLVQALMIGTPTVSTSIGTEGLGLTPGEEVLVADDAIGLATSVSKLLVDDDACKRLASRGRASVLHRHSRAAARAAFVGALEEALGRQAKRKSGLGAELELFRGRIIYQDTQRLRDGLCAALCKVVPEGAGIAVANGGITEFLRLHPFTAWPYPSAELDAAASSDDRFEDAQKDLDRLIAQGAEYLLIPGPSAKWLDERPLLHQYLDATYRIVLNDDDLGLAYALSPQPAMTPSSRTPPPRVQRISVPAAPTLSMSGDGASDTDGAGQGGGGARLIAFYLPQFHPIARERPVVGRGLHRVDQRGQGRAPLPRALPAPHARRSRLLRPPPSGDPSRAGGVGRRLRHLWLLLLPLLVSRQAAAREAVRPRAEVG